MNLRKSLIEIFGKGYDVLEYWHRGLIPVLERCYSPPPVSRWFTSFMPKLATLFHDRKVRLELYCKGRTDVNEIPIRKWPRKTITKMTLSIRENLGVSEPWQYRISNKTRLSRLLFSFIIGIKLAVRLASSCVHKGARTLYHRTLYHRTLYHGHFITRTLYHAGTLSRGHFTTRPLYHAATWELGHFITWTLEHKKRTVYHRSSFYSVHSKWYRKMVVHMKAVSIAAL